MSHRKSLPHSHSGTYTPIPSVFRDLREKWSSDGSRGATRSETLQRSESMVSLCFRTLSGYINDDNLSDLKNLLESKQVQVDDRDENGTTALILAATKGRSGFVRELLAHGADANAEDNDGWTALLCASKEGYADIVLQLLEHTANIEQRDMGNWTSLMWATYKGRLDVVTLLLEKGAEVNVQGNYHISSLLWAAGRGYTQITEALISRGAKVNVGDKYGTTALIWACRKGYAEIVAILLKTGANVDTAGMYSWTALLVATQGNHAEVVNLLLEHKPNVNALDKDGCSALTIACKEGNNEIVTALMAAGAYINVQDRCGDTNLIHAVKGGHRSVVESLLKKYADVDIAGKDQKTAIYVAVEKGNVNIVKLLLSSNPELEIATKDGDTPLLKAVRSRNGEIVHLLLDKKAKVSAADKKGDTALHIAMRARSKGIVEILLRNPKHSQLLYRPNRAGETPYNIDVIHQKTILGQIFGARRLNTNEDNENMLGYDLYSSALADILSEPSLSMPITVGLYAKWGSGKSFLLNKLRDEMKNFAREWVDPVFQFTSLMFLILLHICIIVGTSVGLSVGSWIIGLSLAISLLLVCYILLALVWFANKRYDWDWPYNFNVKLTRKLNNIKLILQVLFCHPPGAPTYDGVSAHPIRFYFTDQTRVSSTTGGENSVVQMIGSLYDAIENDHGALATRLFRAFQPKPVKSSSTWKLRKLCCLPYVVVFEIVFLCVLVGTCALTVYLVHVNSVVGIYREIIQIVLITDALILGVATVANVYTWSKLIKAVLFSQRRHLQRTIAKLETLKSEGFLQALRQEVNLMKDMVKCMDSLSLQQTRLVIVVDGLDSCEQEKVLLILDTVHMLFSDASSPFIVILAIDPHVIAKAVEMNTKRLFSESNIGGHNYLSNMVHLPFYLQNSGLRKVKLAQQTAQAHRKATNAWTENEESLSNFLARSSSNRRLSNESALMSSQEKLKLPGRKNSRKLKLSESVASSIGSNLNRIGGAQDLTKMLLTDDYFSDVNPRSMRRLMNVVYITGRLLKAFQVDFNWYRLASWINITEQWPFRTSWMIYHYELYEDSLDDNTSLKSIFEKIRPHIPTVKDTEPLLELDRDEKKLDIFLTFHRSSLLVSDLKIFLPFTISLDPYLKKVIKEETQCWDDDGLLMTMPRNMPLVQPMPWATATSSDWNSSRPALIRRNRSVPKTTLYQQASPGMMGWPNTWNETVQATNPHVAPLAPVTSLAPEVFEKRLSLLNVDGVCKLLNKIEDINFSSLPDYNKVIKDNNITGKVLLHCDLDELKQLLKMTFGDWEMFKVVLISLREHEATSVYRYDESSNLRIPKQERKGSVSKSYPVELETKEVSQRKQSVMEKQYQVTLEEQMICGALQTLNEEACEDVLEETEETKVVIELDVPQTSIIPPSPESNQDYVRGFRSRTNSASGVGETEFVLLQSSPVGHMHWQPVSISVGGNPESLSEHSSRASSQPPSPAAERKYSNGIKLSNLKSTTEEGSRKGRHVVIKTEAGDSSHVRAVYHQDETTRTPSLQEFGSTQRPSSLHLKKDTKPIKPIMRSRSKSIDCQKKKSDKNFEKLQRFKEKLLHSSPELNENSDNESTPLVSEVSTPSKSGQSSEVRSSNSNSFPLSPLSQKSLSPELKHRQTRSEQNLTDTTDVSPVLSFHDNIYLSNTGTSSGGNSLSPKNVPLVRTMSESASITGMVRSCSNISLPSGKNSGDLCRQTALESEEDVADCYCDPSRGG